MKKILFSLLFVVLATSVFGQQIPQYSQYLRNQFMVNPAAAGIYDFTDITMKGRMQWVGFENAPMTSYLSVSSPLIDKPKVRYNPSIMVSSGPVKNPEIKTGSFKHAFGGQVLIDQYGAFRKMQMGGTYAIHMPLSTNYNMSFGTRLGISNNSFLPEKAQVLDQNNDNTYTTYTANRASKNFVDLGFGLYFYSKKMFLGFSADQLTQDMIAFGSGTPYFNPKVYMNMTAGIKLDLTSDLTIQPSILVKYMDPAPVSIEGTIQIEYKEWLWTAFSYRQRDAIVGMVGLNLNRQLKFGYSYDYSISQFRGLSSGGHELVLGIMLR
jgi:type IX secretion system PorP/SprF family membrane protein